MDDEYVDNTPPSSNTDEPAQNNDVFGIPLEELEHELEESDDGVPQGEVPPIPGDTKNY